MQVTLSLIIIGFGLLVPLDSHLNHRPCLFLMLKVYYAIPFSFIFFLWALAMTLFVAIILAMVVGLALLGSTYTPLRLFLSLIKACIPFCKDS